MKTVKVRVCPNVQRGQTKLCLPLAANRLLESILLSRCDTASGVTMDANINLITDWSVLLITLMELNPKNSLDYITLGNINPRRFQSDLRNQCGWAALRIQNQDDPAERWSLCSSAVLLAVPKL